MKSASNSAENEEQVQETCRSLIRLRFDEKKVNYLLYYLQQIEM